MTNPLSDVCWQIVPDSRSSCTEGSVESLISWQPECLLWPADFL